MSDTHNHSTGEMQPPPSIWLQWHGDAPESDKGPVSEEAATWARHGVFPRDIEYIRADIAMERPPADKDREALLIEAGNNLRKSAEMIGCVQDAQHYRDSVKYIAAWDKLIATPLSPAPNVKGIPSDEVTGARATSNAARSGAGEPS